MLCGYEVSRLVNVIKLQIYSDAVNMNESFSRGIRAMLKSEPRNLHVYIYMYTRDASVVVCLVV